MKKTKLFIIFFIIYAVVVFCWIWLLKGNPSVIGFVFFQIPIFLIFFISLIILDWSVFRRKLGKRFIVYSEITLLAVLFSIFSVKTATLFYEIEDDAKWFVVVYSDEVENENIHNLFPLNKVMYIESEELNFISKDLFRFRKKWERGKNNPNIPTYSFRFLFSDTIGVNNSRSYNDDYDFEIYAVGSYHYQDSLLHESDWEIIKIKIENYINSDIVGK